MGFLTPALLGLAGLAIPIIVLYMLRLRRRETPVSSVMLWQRLVQDREANTPWQKLRRNLLLILQLLILAALVLALIRPFLPVPGIAAGSVALLIDASASMGAREGNSTRFELAQAQARRIIGDLPGDEVMTLIAVGPTPEVLSPPTGDQSALRAALGRAQVSEGPADWEAALALAAASVAGRENAALVVLSDGGLPDDLPAMPVEVRYVPVGEATENLAIRALAIRDLDGVPQAFVAVVNYGTLPQEAILSIEADGDVITAERIRVEAGGALDYSLGDLSPELQVLRATLEAPAGSGWDDALAVDNSAQAVYEPPAGGEVLLVSEGNLFLEQMLRAFPTLRAFLAEPDEVPSRSFDLVIADGVALDPLPQSNLLIINPPASNSLYAVGESFRETRLLRQAEDPILGFVDFSAVAIREARLVQAGPWAQTLVEADGGPLLIAGTSEGRRIAILPFDLRDSDLPLRIDFPILFANLLEWYAPARAIEAADALRPGDPVTVQPGPFSTQVRITQPDGGVIRVPASGEAITFTQTEQVGIYRVELIDGLETVQESAFAVNLFAPEESRVAPVSSLTIGRDPVAGIDPGDRTGQRELWAIPAALALIVLIAEWWVFHRGAQWPTLADMPVIRRGARKQG